MHTLPSRAAAAALALAVLAGCSSTHAPRRTLLTRGQSPIQLDGELGDWDNKAAVIADSDWIYFHTTVEDASAPIQAAPETLALWLDADGNAATGAKMPGVPDAASMGVDAVIEFSPADPEHPGQTKRGVTVVAPAAAGPGVSINHDQIGLLCLPSYATTGYEMRISRHLDAATAPGLAKALAASGKGRAMFVLKDGAGKILGWSDPETFSKPAASAAAPHADARIPAKPRGAVRIVSYNVEKSKLAAEPQSFARLFEVLDADVILCQEWNADSATATAWFTAIVTGAHPWNARAAAGDVVIVSPHPIAPLGPDALTLPTEGGSDEKAAPVRFVAAVVKTPAGDVAVGTTHLKCCGTAGSVEDKTRQAQASAINAALRNSLTKDGPRVRVFAGDLNLVGTRAPLEMIRAGLDADGADLAVANPLVLGDDAMYTWTDPNTEFSAGRLDFALYSGSTAQAVQAFVVDTSRLSAKSLARMGLDAGDTSASDHFPVVLDLKPR
jgi:endonuclease/exonuclease/phosphatase family metal-dependent hydrolase